VVVVVTTAITRLTAVVGAATTAAVKNRIMRLKRN